MLSVKSFKHSFDILTMSTKDHLTTLSYDLGHGVILIHMKPSLEESRERFHKIRITLSFKHVQNLRKVCTNQNINVEMSCRGVYFEVLA